MRSLIRLFGWAAACVAVFGVVWAFAGCEPGVLAAMDLSDAGHSLMIAVHEAQALDAQSETLNERLAGKQEVVAALLDGRLSLREAGDQFRRMNTEGAEDAGAELNEATCQPDVLSDEAVYENLLAWVDWTASAKPRWGASAARIHAELESLLHRPPRGL